MPQVTIPAKHFTHNVKKNYSYPDKALIREFLQNSVDAGSTTIDFIFDEEQRKLTVIDDGCGMTHEILVDALLTMSGTHKGEHSIGGFGAAKEILLFQHDEYKVITSKDGISTSVVGRQLDYEFVNDSLGRDGTTVEIVFHEEYNINNFENNAKSYLGTCSPSAIIRWNNEPIMPCIEKGDEVPLGTDWCNVYAVECNFQQYYAYIRINGVTMFEAWVSDTNYMVVVELTKPSLDILTVNRDGFTHKYSQQLGQLIYNISVEKGAFGKAYNTSTVYRGNEKAYYDIQVELEAILEEVDRKFAEHNTKLSETLSTRKSLAEETIKAIEEVSKECSSETPREQVAEKIIERVKDNTWKCDDIPNKLIDHMIQDLVCDHVADFHIRVTAKNVDEVPTHLKPGNWGKTTISWAKLWKHCVKLAMRANGIVVPYTVGWVIDESEQCYALYERVEDTHIFYMNPMLTWMRSSNHSNVFLKMLMNACHEVCHIHNKYHDENFMQQYETILHRTMCFVNRTGNTWWKEFRASKEETI